MKKQGVDVPSLGVNIVDQLLTEDISQNVRELLILRQIFGRSSTAKYKKIQDMETDGRVYNNLQYYGAGTGRWAGRGFQMHNLPRASVEDPDDAISRFNRFDPIDDPVNVAKALIRPMIQAPPGKTLIVSDYSSIENRILAWVAEDYDMLQKFVDGVDQYKAMAEDIYGIPADKVNKTQRQVGKVAELGCGFGMGGLRFVDSAAQFGVTVFPSLG